MTGFVRRSTPTLMVVCAALLGGVLAASPSAYAGGRFVFEAAFGKEGEGAGEFKGPLNAAVEQASGDLFVADEGNERVQVFEPDGQAVTNEADEPVIIGISEVPPGLSSRVTGVAIDNSGGSSSGDVYVVDKKNKVVDKFAPRGASPSKGYEYVCQLVGIGGGCVKEGGSSDEPFGFPGSVSVDAEGNVYVAQYVGEGTELGSIDEFDSEGASIATFTVPIAKSVAVNPSGSIIYAVDGVSNSTIKLTVDPETHAIESEEVLDSEGSTAVAVAPTTGDVIVDDSSEEAHINVYEADAEAGEEPIERFGANEIGQIGESYGVAYSTYGDGKVYVTDALNDDVHIYAQEPSQPPIVECEPATEIVADAATLECSIEPKAEEIEWRLEYRKAGSSGWTRTSGGTLTSAGKVKERVSLEPETEYIYRGSATNKVGGEAGRSAKARFMTPVAFELITGLAVEITSNSAVVTGEANPEGIEARSLFDYGFTKSYGSSSESSDDGAGMTLVPVSERLEGLEPHMIYHYRLTGENIQGETGNGQDAEFTTLTEPPAVNATVSGVTRQSAMLSGTVNPENSKTEYRFEYGTSQSYGMETPDTSAGEGFGEEVVGPARVSGLRPETTYHFRMVASNEDEGILVGTSTTTDQTFTTGAAILPTVGAGEASSVTLTSATISDTVNPEGEPTSWELQLGTDTGYGGARIYGQAVEGEETIVLELHNLTPGTTYHYRIVASDEDGSTSGLDATFTTLGVPSPIVQPPTAILIGTPAIAFPTEPGKVVKRPAKKKKTSKKKRKVGKKHRAKNRA